MTDASEIHNAYLAGANRAHQANARDASMALAEANATIRRLNNRALTAEAEVARLTDALAVEKAHAEGLAAQTMAFATQHPDSPLMVDSGKRYKVSGNMKLLLMLAPRRWG